MVDLPCAGTDELAAPLPDAARAAALRGPAARQLADIYPAFAERVFGINAP